MHQEFTSITTLLQYAQETPGHLGKGVYVVGTVSESLAADISNCSGLNVVGYRITIDHSAIIHALRQHGQAVEVLRGQLPVDQADVIDLAGWLPTPTVVSDAGQLKGRLRCLRFELSTVTSRTIAILEVRTGRSRTQLSLKSLLQKKAGSLSNQPFK